VVLTAAALALLAASVAEAVPPPSSVSITAGSRTVVYGAQTTLSGVVLPAQANEKVSVVAQACQENGLPTLAGSATPATASTTANGSWATNVTPLVTTSYTAKVKRVTSSPIRISVRPQVTLTKVGTQRYEARVTAARSFVGRRALFQRFRPARSTWSTVRSVTLRSSQTATAPAVVTSATFRSKVRAGRQVRLALPRTQTGSCYVAGRSAPIAS
jgi:hypothetical protein